MCHPCPSCQWFTANLLHLLLSIIPNSTLLYQSSSSSPSSSSSSSSSTSSHYMFHYISSLHCITCHTMHCQCFVPSCITSHYIVCKHVRSVWTSIAHIYVRVLMCFTLLYMYYMCIHMCSCVCVVYVYMCVIRCYKNYITLCCNALFFERVLNLSK